MRIIGGAKRGLQLASPEGSITRPTTDRAREALFNILAHRKGGPLLAGAHFVDIFAGSGSVALEAASRGAALITMVEQDRKAQQIIAQNCTKMGLAAPSLQLIKSDAQLLPAAKQLADFLFLDPPYHQGLLAPVLTRCLQQGWIGPESLVIIQHDRGEALEIPAAFTLLETRLYGRNGFSFYRHLGAAGATTA